MINELLAILGAESGLTDSLPSKAALEKGIQQLEDIGEFMEQQAKRLEEKDRLMSECLEEHCHLADGDDCTLKKIKDALEV